MAYDPHHWSDFLVATVGASASLTGLLFVAISINLTRILQYRNLPARAAETLALLLLLVVVDSCGLAPQGARAFGVEVVCLSAAYVGTVGAIQVHHGPESPTDPWFWFVGRVVTVQVGAVLLLAAGLSLVAGGGGGLYWLVAASGAVLTGAVFNAWVFLVQIVDDAEPEGPAVRVEVVRERPEPGSAAP